MGGREVDYWLGFCAREKEKKEKKIVNWGEEHGAGIEETAQRVERKDWCGGTEVEGYILDKEIIKDKREGLSGIFDKIGDYFVAGAFRVFVLPIAIAGGLIEKSERVMNGFFGYTSPHRHISIRQAKKYLREEYNFYLDKETGAGFFADPSQTKVGRKISSCSGCAEVYDNVKKERAN